MKYVILIIDGAAGHPIPSKGKKTSLELAQTPNLDNLVKKGKLGLTCNVPSGMEPSSAIACLSILGFDPRTYYRGRSGIEAVSMGIEVGQGEGVFRCNLVALKDGKMWDYSAGHITTPEARELIQAVDASLGTSEIKFFPGVSYRHLLKIKGHLDSLEADCTPPHDIPGKALAGFLPKGKGGQFLLDLMHKSEAVLSRHPVNQARIARGQIPATSIWLFWPSGQIPELPSFQQQFGLKAGIISGVDLLRGLGRMAKMDVIQVAGVTDGLDNDYTSQAEGALKALEKYDLVVVHVEAPDEAGHSGSIEHKIEAIEKTDREIVQRLARYDSGKLRLLVLPDHPTPIDIQTHTPEQVPFVLSGDGFSGNGATRLTEAEAKNTGFLIENGYDIIKTLIQTQ